jgi:hypothetical protein
MLEWSTLSTIVLWYMFLKRDYANAEILIIKVFKARERFLVGNSEDEA